MNLSLISAQRPGGWLASLLLAGLLAARPAAAQVPIPSKVYLYAEQMPTLPGGGGQAAVVALIQQALRYPPEALRKRVEGRVFATFTVLPNGAVDDIKIVKGIGAGCDEAAREAIGQLPRFVPGRHEDQAVAVAYTVPITFQLAAAPTASAAAPAPPDSTRIYYAAMPMPALPEAALVALAESIKKGLSERDFRQFQLGGGPLADPIQAFVEQAVKLPAEVTSGKVEGKVRVSFLVGTTGLIRGTRIAKHLSAATDSAALQAVRRLPRLVPGRVQGRPAIILRSVEVPFFGPGHVYEDAHQPPEFPVPGLEAYLRQHLRVPAIVATENLEGEVEASFVVGVDGRVRSPEIKQGLCTSCDAEVLRFLKALPAYQPARHYGQPVAVRQYLSVPMPLLRVDKDSLTRVYTYVEQMPALAGSDGSGSTYAIATAVQRALVLPAEVKSGEVTGKVFVKFIVGPRGGVYGLKAERTLSPACDAAALAAVWKLPRMQGGKQNGRGVAVSIMLPVIFAQPEAGK